MSDQPIHEAARRADRDALRRELENGVSANAFGYCPGSIDGTPLHYLCLGNDNAEARVECVHMLIEAGADINASNVRPHRDLRSEVRPPKSPAGDGPPRRRVRVPRGGLLRNYILR